ALPVIVFAIMALAEWRWPRRALISGRRRRWTTNGSMLAAGRATVWILAYLVAVPAAALWAQHNGIGLLNLMTLPFWAKLVTSFILLDFVMWLQHLATHRVPLLWRMHQVHHADRDLDVTTGFRFHPFEIAISTLWKAACVVALGVPAIVYLAFEAWLGANALFNHSNITLPPRVERGLRRFLVTPGMHLVHHSTIPTEQQSNYGFALTIWDRLFGTYKPVSALGHEAQTIGLSKVHDDRAQQIGYSLGMPFRKL
ncbi:MAG: sterol desaturase family protein, partial [Sphingorhabdus sp.]